MRFVQRSGIITINRFKESYDFLLDRLKGLYGLGIRGSIVAPALIEEFTGREGNAPTMGAIAAEWTEMSEFVDFVSVINTKNASSPFAPSNLGAADAVFKGFKRKPAVIWIQSPEVRELLSYLERFDLAPSDLGKGVAWWLGCGLSLATGMTAIGTHDCDIRTGVAEIVPRLLAPCLDIDLPVSVKINKAKYARIENDEMRGRVSRLFFAPLISTLLSRLPDNPTLRFLRLFGYPLSGEMAMRREVALSSPFAYGYGLETAFLIRAYSYRESVAETEFPVYDHFHQTEGNLAKMVAEIARVLLSELKREGYDVAHFLGLAELYEQKALDFVYKYHVDAASNGLRYDRDREIERVVHSYSPALRGVVEHLAANNGHGAKMYFEPWDKVFATAPEARERLLRCVR